MVQLRTLSSRLGRRAKKSSNWASAKLGLSLCQAFQTLVRVKVFDGGQARAIFALAQLPMHTQANAVGQHVFLDSPRARIASLEIALGAVIACYRQ